MTQNRSNANLSTLVLYAQKDRKYVDDLESHLHLMVDGHGLGYLRCASLEEEKIIEKEATYFTDRPSCIMCLLSPNFIYQMRLEEAVWVKLVRAHNAQQVFIIPVIAEDCSRYSHPLEKLKALPSPCTPLSELAFRGDYPTHLADLGAACQKVLSTATRHYERVNLNWTNTKNAGTCSAYENFCNTYGSSKYGVEAKQKFAELKEKELWESASAFDQTAHYMHYVAEAPLKTHQEEALEKIIDFEKSKDLLEDDVTNDTDLGLLFDYKSRFRKELDTKLVNERLNDVFAQPLRLAGDHAWARSEAHALKLKVFESCEPQEVHTYTLLEETGKALLRKLADLKKKLTKKRSGTVFFLQVGYPIILLSIAFFAMIISEKEIVPIVSAWVNRHPFIFSWVLLAFVLIYRHLLRALATEIERCDELVNVVEQDLVAMKIAFVNKTEYTQPVRRLHYIEEWGVYIESKKTVDYMLNGAEEINLKSLKITQL